MAKKLLLLCASLLLAIGAHAQAGAGFIKLNTSPVTTTAYTDSTCPDSGVCYYQVTAVDASGHESTASLCSTTLGANVSCFNSNQLKVVIPATGTHSVSLSWIASTTTPAPTYNVYFSTVAPPTGMTATVN